MPRPAGRNDLKATLEKIVRVSLYKLIELPSQLSFLGMWPSTGDLISNIRPRRSATMTTPRPRMVTETGILKEMQRRCYTPWSAICSVRQHEEDILFLECRGCKLAVLEHCAFLMECAVYEASKEHDWLVRNEAMIQFCWTMYYVDTVANDAGSEEEEEGTQQSDWEQEQDLTEDTEEDGEDLDLAYNILVHRVALESRDGSLDIPSIVVMYEIDHGPIKNHLREKSSPSSKCIEDLSGVRLENPRFLNG